MKLENIERSLRSVIEKLNQDFAANKIKTDAHFLSVNEELQRL
jgi:hypothetical protein